MKNISTIFACVVLFLALTTKPAPEPVPQPIQKPLQGKVVRGQANAAQETRGRIAVIDTGPSLKQIGADYMCKDIPVFTVLNRTGLDHHGHGTNVIGLIAERINKKKYCITSYSLSPSNPVHEYMYFLNKILEHGAVGVNLSLEGPFVIEGEAELLEKITEKAKVFVAAGNGGLNLDEKCHAYPACYRNQNKKINVVGNKKFLFTYGNYGKIVNIWKNGVNKGFPNFTGSSQSTAIATGEHFAK